MSVLRAGLLHQLLAPRVAPYFEAASSLVSQHFDVFLFTSKDEAQFVLHNIATEFLCQTPNRFDLPASVADIGVLNKNGRGKPLLYVSDVLLPRGSGFVELKVPPVLELLPSLSQIVSQVLNHLGLSQFIDAFDGRRMSQLREILRLEVCRSLLMWWFRLRTWRAHKETTRPLIKCSQILLQRFDKMR